MRRTLSLLAAAAALTVTSSAFAAEIPISVTTAGDIAPGQDWAVASGGGFINEPCVTAVDLSDQPREIIVTLSNGHQDVFSYQPTFFGFGSAAAGGCIGVFEILSDPSNLGELNLGPTDVLFGAYTGSPNIFWDTGATDITFSLSSLLFGRVFEPGYSYTLDGQRYNFERTVSDPVPVPGALAIFLTGLGMFVGRRCRLNA